MKKNIVLLLSCLILTAMSCKSKKVTVIETPTVETPSETAPANVTWNFNTNAKINLNDILIQAKAEKKLVFIDAYATWCGPCKLMDRTVFTHSPTADYFNKNFISYKLDIEKNNGPTVKLLYDVNALPGLLFLDSEGKLLLKEENSVTISQLRKLGENAVAKAKK